MKVISLEMHNFRKFKNTSIEFPEGIIGLVGNNGAGKSTIIEAIGWAIYGNKAARTKKDMIKRQGAGMNEECWVKLVFEMGGNVYDVFRIITRSSTDARVKVNGTIVASSTQGATEYLEKMLGMDYDSFYTSIIARQQELNTLSNKSPGERKKSMLRMLKIDVLEEAIKKVREDRRNMEKTVDYMEKMMKDISLMEAEKKRNVELLKGYTEKLKEMEEHIKKMEVELKEKEEKREIERKRAEKFKKLEERRKLLEERRKNMIASMERKMKELDELKQRKKEYENLKKYIEEYENLARKREEMDGLRIKYMEKRRIEEKLEELDREIEELNKSIDLLMKEMGEEEKIKEEMKKIKEEMEGAEREIEEIGREIEKEMAEIGFIDKRRREIEEKKMQIEKLGPSSNCPTCGRVLGERYEQLLLDYENEIKKLEEEAERYRRRIEELKGRRDVLLRNKEEIGEREREMENRMVHYRGLMERMEIFKERKENNERRRREYVAKAEELRKITFDENVYEEIVSTLKRIEPLKNRAMIVKEAVKKIAEAEKEIDEMKNEVAITEKETEECIEEIKELDFNPEEYEIIEKDYEEIKNQFHSLREEYIRMEGKIETIRREMGRIEEEIEEQKRMEEEIKKLRKEISNLEMLAGDRDTGLLNNFKNYLISKIGPLLSHHASHFFALFTDGKYREIEIDDNYNIWIYDRGEKFELDRFSGGEKDLANLSLRLAISQLIAQRADVALEFIALDEIFGSQDRERRKNVLNALAELKRQFRQILLITHIEEIKDAMESIIKVYEDDEGISHVIIE